MIFDYSATKTFNQSIDIVDPGNMGLKCYSDEGSEYYIIVKSIMGRLNFLFFGPIIDGVENFIETFTLQYKNTKYSEKTIMKEIKSFINDPIKKICEIEEVTPEEIIMNFPNLVNYWKNI